MLETQLENPPDALSGASQVRRSGGASDLAERLAALPAMSHADLRDEWRRLYRSFPPKKIGRDLLELAIACKLQERALGGMSAAMRRRIVDLAQMMESKGDLMRPRTVALKPGAKLVREWRGDAHEVLVIENGFLWRGKRWRSLSVIAEEITGTHWSGPRFFGLVKKMDGKIAPATVVSTSATVEGETARA